MASVNKVILIGNLGQDPEVRYTAAGMAVCNISIATTSYRKGRDGEREEETQWHRITLFDKLAETAGEYLKKGKQVYIEGSLKYGKYTNKEGVEVPTTEVVAASLTLLGKRDDDEPRSGGRAAPASRGREEPQRQPARPANPAHKPASRGGFDDMDDDIPF